MTDGTTLLHHIALASLRGINIDTATLIEEHLGSVGRFFELPEAALREVIGGNSRLLSDDVRHKAVREAAMEVEFINRNSIRTLWHTDSGYPKRLAQCPDAPLMLYAIGDTDLNSARIISIVGTRHATVYGTGFVEDAITELADKLADPLVVVSGLAYGIDIAAHKASLKANVPTVGVLAHGLNTIYPASHRDIAVRMVRSEGMLLTDYRTVDHIHRGNFLARNRIVAGLADCLLVAESDIHGGALVTAKLASSYSRDVFALPGRASDRYSRGCNSLIASDTARLVTSPTDIIDLMGWTVKSEEGTQPALFTELTPEEEAIVAVIRAKGDASLTDLLCSLDTPVHRIMSTLIDLESRSIILALPGSLYRLN
ncbi:MAG: DNA-processing protein DprA [Muribaculaceae bacterium]|nr:DNA-processing protein DprA [Muribaculaceae bacterium]